MSDNIYSKFVARWQEVTDLPPQTVGPFTPLYKKFTRRLKVMPWPLLVLVSVVLVTALYYLLGSTIVFVVSILQRGI